MHDNNQWQEEQKQQGYRSQFQDNNIGFHIDYFDEQQKRNNNTRPDNQMTVHNYNYFDYGGTGGNMYFSHRG